MARFIVHAAANALPKGDHHQISSGSLVCAWFEQTTGTEHVGVQIRLLVKSGPANARHSADLKERRTAKLLTGRPVLPIDAACLGIAAMNTWLIVISLALSECARMHRSEGVANLASRMDPMSPFPGRRRVQLRLASLRTASRVVR